MLSKILALGSSISGNYYFIKNEGGKSTLTLGAYVFLIKM
jgi:hypothetical protein